MAAGACDLDFDSPSPNFLQVDGDIPNEYEWPVPFGSVMNLMNKWTNKPTSQPNEIPKKRD